MISSTDSQRFSQQQLQQRMGFPMMPMSPTPASPFEMFQQPTQVAPAPTMQPEPPMRSVLKGRAEEEQRSEENIRRMIEQMRGKQDFLK